MRLFPILAILSAAVALPQRHPAITACSSVSSVDDCAPGGKCDCSRIADTNSEEYFQCVTNPNCERCCVTRSRNTTTPSADVNFQTMKPGTYTITTNGTVLDVIVTQEVATPTRASTTSRVFVTRTRTVVVTIADTAPTASRVTAEAASTEAASSTAPDKAETATKGVTKTTTVHPRPTCPQTCDCSKIQDKNSEA